MDTEPSSVPDAIDSLVEARTALLSESKTTLEKQLLAEEIDDIVRRLKAIQPDGDGEDR